jgi:hypothetical protein
MGHQVREYHSNNVLDSPTSSQDQSRLWYSLEVDEERDSQCCYYCCCVAREKSHLCLYCEERHFHEMLSRAREERLVVVISRYCSAARLLLLNDGIFS